MTTAGATSGGGSSRRFGGVAGNRHRCRPAELEREHARRIRRDVRVTRELACGEPERAAPADLDGDVLLAAGLVRDRRREYPGAGRDRPQLAPVPASNAANSPIASPWKHEIARGREHAAVPRMLVLHAPDLALRDRIPGGEVPLQARLASAP